MNDTMISVVSVRPAVNGSVSLLRLFSSLAQVRADTTLGTLGGTTGPSAAAAEEKEPGGSAAVIIILSALVMGGIIFTICGLLVKSQALVKSTPNRLGGFSQVAGGSGGGGFGGDGIDF